MTQQVTDPFAQTDKKPSVSFKDKPIGTSYTGTVTEAPSLVQARDFDTGELDFWKDGNPKMTVVTGLNVNGEDLNLWAPKPSALFGAIGAAQNAAGAQIAVGGTLTVTFTGEKPNERNPRLNPQKLYTVTYQPPNAFEGTVDPWAGQQGSPVAPVQQAAPVQPAAPQAPPAPQATPGVVGTLNGQPVTHEAFAAMKAAGIDPSTQPGFVPA